MNTFKLEHLSQSEGEIITNETNLSICLRANGFIFSIIDLNYRLKAVGEFTVDLNCSMTQIMINIKTCFESIGVRIFNFKAIKVICQTEAYTWVPFKLYDKQKNKEYLQTVAPVVSSQTILSNVVTKLDNVNVFAAPMHQITGIKVLMPKAQYFSVGQVLAEYAFDISSLNTNTFILYQRDNGADFAIFKGGDFVLSNTLQYTLTDDLIYYILNLLKQLNIDTSEVNLLLTGQNYDTQELQLLKHYVKYVSFANYAENVNISYEFDGVNMQRYFLVLA